jgi:hypothetical protein
MSAGLIFNPFENSFFCLENFTFRASPGIRDVFPCSTRCYSIFGIPFERIINVMAFEAYPPVNWFRIGHDKHNSKIIFLLYSLTFSWCSLLNTSIQISYNRKGHFSPSFIGEYGEWRAQSRATRSGSGMLPSRVKSLHSLAASSMGRPQQRTKMI